MQGGGVTMYVVIFIKSYLHVFMWCFRFYSRQRNQTLPKILPLPLMQGGGVTMYVVIFIKSYLHVFMWCFRFYSRQRNQIWSGQCSRVGISVHRNTQSGSSLTRMELLHSRRSLDGSVHVNVGSVRWVAVPI